MNTNVLFYLLLVPVMIGFLRAILIVSGLYKAPILQSLEEYGTDKRYSPLVSLVVWGVACVFMLLWLLLGFPLLMALLLFLSLPLGLIYQRVETWIETYPRLFLSFPLWYWTLLNTTNRDEQRRLAYMWLRLPMRTQWLYNTHDALFRQWTDLVLLSMV